MCKSVNMYACDDSGLDFYCAMQVNHNNINRNFCITPHFIGLCE